jgi:HEAT repeat protein
MLKNSFIWFGLCIVAAVTTPGCSRTTNEQPSDDQGVSAHIEALQNGDPNQREEAAKALGEIGPDAKAAVPALVAAVTRDEESSVRKASGEALAAIGADAVPELLPFLNDSDSTVRWRSVHTLELLGPSAKDALPQIIKRLEDRDLRVRMEAVDALAAVDEGGDETIQALIDALKDGGNIGFGMYQKGGSESVSAAVVAAMLRMGPKAEKELVRSGIPILVRGLTDRDRSIRDHSARALGLLGPKAAAAAPALAEMCSDKDEQLRSAAADALARIEGSNSFTLIATLRDGNVNARREAARTLGRTRPVANGTVAALTDALKDKDAEVRASAVESLGWIGPAAAPATAALIASLSDKALISAGGRKGDKFGYDKHPAVYSLRRIGVPAVPSLIEALKDEDVLVRSSAAQTLGLIGFKAKNASQALRTALGDKSDVVRVEAACSILCVGEEDKKSVEVLTGLLRHEDAAIRFRTASALSRVGSQAKAVVPALVSALKDGNASVRRAVLFALTSFGPDAQEAVPALADVLRNDPDGLVRVRAAEALAEIGPGATAAAAALVAALDDGGMNRIPNPVFTALRKLGPGGKAIVPAMIHAIRTSDPRRNDFVYVLASIGPEAKEAVPLFYRTVERRQQVSPRRGDGCTGRHRTRRGTGRQQANRTLAN